MKKQISTILLCLLVVTKMTAQTPHQTSDDFKMPEFVIKSNLLYDLTSTLNLGTEFKLSDKYTMDVSLNYNPWTFANNKKLKHVLVQPELRYWKDQTFKGHFFGLHAIYAHYNVGGIDLSSSLNENRYQGDLYGLGASYGYQWRLSPSWSVEATIGLGYIHSSYDKYECQTCGQFVKSDSKNYFGPTKAGLSLIYILK